MAEILSYNADIICLQEVDAVIHDTLFRPVLEAKGYQGFYSNKVSQARQRESQARQRESRAREHQQISNDINPSNGASSSEQSLMARHGVFLFLCVIFLKCKMIQGETKSSNFNGHMVAEKLILMKERVR